MTKTIDIILMPQLLTADEAAEYNLLILIDILIDGIDIDNY